MLTYRQILSKAWQITWQNPVLWFFGFFLAFLGVGGEIELLLNTVSLDDSQGLIPSLITGFAEGGLFSPSGLLGTVQAILNRPFPMFSLLLWLVTILLLAAAVIWLVIVSQGAIISGVVSVVKRKREGWAWHFESGLKTFWPVLILNVLTRIIFFGLLLALSALSFWQFPGSTLLFLAAFILLAGVMVIISFITKFAVCAVVLRGESVGGAIDAGVKLFLRHWLLSLEVASVMFFIYWLVTVLLVNLLSSFFLSTLRVFGPEGSVAFVSFIIVLVITAISELLLAVFHWSAWVLVFEVLTNKKTLLTSRISGWFEKMVSR